MGKKINSRQRSIARNRIVDHTRKKGKKALSLAKKGKFKQAFKESQKPLPKNLQKLKRKFSV